MSAWWSRTSKGVEKHAGRQPKLSALIRLNFARNMGDDPLDALGLYRRDPAKHPDEPNVFAEIVQKAEAKALSDMLKGGKRRAR